MSQPLAKPPAGEFLQTPGAPRAKPPPRFGAVDADAVARAEAALKSLSGQFGQWLQDEVDKLESARARVRAEGATPAAMEALHGRAHDLKGLGGTYEFPLITRVMGSLCRLLEEPAQRAAAPLALVDAHIDAVRAIVRDDIKDPAHPVGEALCAALEGEVAAHGTAQAA